MKIIAHRGASGNYPENSREAFRAAYEMEANAVETDVWRCPECRKLKLSHDPILSEDDCKKLVDLREVFDFGETSELIFEIKEKGVYKEIAAITEKLKCRDRIIYSSSLWLELYWLNSTGKGKRIGLLWDVEVKKIPKIFVVLAACLIGAESIHLDIEMIKKDKTLVEYFQAKGFGVWSYTLNSERDIELAKKLNLDGIFTDYPAYAFYLIYGKTGD